MCLRGVEGEVTPLVCQASLKVWVANSDYGGRWYEHRTVPVQGPLERHTVVEDPELCAEKEYSVRAERSQSLRLRCTFPHSDLRLGSWAFQMFLCPSS